MSMMDRRAWTRFVAITRPFFLSEVRWRAMGALALLIILILTVTGLNVVNSYVGRDFMTSIEERHLNRFTTFALLYAAVFALSTVVAVSCRYTEERLGLLWREWLTRHLIDRYLASHTYYRLNGRGDIDNPDQRIAEDVKTFTTTSLSLVLILLNSTITLFSFSGILWSITPWLFVAAVSYATFGSLMAILLGKRLVGLDVLQLKKEADFRFDLIRIRSSAEPVALLRGEDDERARLFDRLAAVVQNWKVIIGVNRNLGCFTEGYNYMIQLLPALIVAPLFFRGEIKFGTVTQAAMAFSFAMGAFSLIVKEFGRLTTFAAVVARLGTAWDAMERTQADGPGGVETVEDEDRLAFEGLTLQTPREGQTLIKDLHLELPRGQRLLILGPSGSGRTSLLRSTAGLWSRGKGRIVRPPLDQVMFLPQKPHLEPGTLRDQLLYALPRKKFTDEQLMAVLRKVKFEPVLTRVGGLDVERDWPNILSLGEQQLLGFARLFLAHPPYAFLDEATRALDAQRGRQMYELLSQTPITYVSVGLDRSLMEYHDQLLELHGHGAWTVVPRTQAASA